ncbi:unnamed protein product [Discosporangium mesarthrocarpum]
MVWEGECRGGGGSKVIIFCVSRQASASLAAYILLAWRHHAVHTYYFHLVRGFIVFRRRCKKLQNPYPFYVALLEGRIACWKEYETKLVAAIITTVRFVICMYIRSREKKIFKYQTTHTACHGN